MYLELIPQDITFDHYFSLCDDTDAFVEKIINYLSDRVIERNHLHENTRSEKFIYTIEQDRIRVNMMNDLIASNLSGLRLQAHTQNAEEFDKFIAGFIDVLGIEFDGTESVITYSGLFYDYYQTKDGSSLPNNVFLTSIDSFSSSGDPHMGRDSHIAGIGMFIGNWNHNLSEMVLYDIDKSIQNGREYVRQYELYSGPACNVYVSEYVDNDPYDNNYIFHKRTPCYYGLFWCML